MFFLKKIGTELKVTPTNKVHEDFNRIISIETPKNVVIIGKNTIYDPEITVFNKNKTISFIGELFCSLELENIMENIDVYMLDNDLGYLIKNHDNEVYLSKSYYFLTDFFSKELNIQINQMINNSELGVRLSVFNINNDFNVDTPIVKDRDIDENEHSIMGLGWEKSPNDIPFQVIVSQKSVQVKEDDFAKTYMGFALNIGTFKQTMVMNISDVVPIKYRDYELFDCLEFTTLINQDPKNYLVPHVMSSSEYRSMLFDLRSQGRTIFTFSGLSSRGYTVQAEIEIDESLSTAKEIIAKITSLILIPALYSTKNVKPM